MNSLTIFVMTVVEGAILTAIVSRLALRSRVFSTLAFEKAWTRRRHRFSLSWLNSDGGAVGARTAVKRVVATRVDIIVLFGGAASVTATAIVKMHGTDKVEAWASVFSGSLGNARNKHWRVKH